MKTKLFISTLLIALFASPIFAQDRTTVNATSSEISDNLDLRAVASIFGDAKDLEDFERQLNDPTIQISNLDLNNDNQVDYLRVIESVEGNTHLIIVQSVLGRDSYQDVATIEVEKDRHNNVQVQVVGDVYMYGQNYIYEPVYVHTPYIYTSFWVTSYRPYCSLWYWDYYPTYYYAWNPCPIFRYRNNINIHINFNHHYNYVNVRRCERAVAMHNIRRGDYCERNYPTRAFTYRNTNYSNRHDLDQIRTFKNVTTRNETAYSKTRENQPIRSSANSTTRDYGSTRENQTIRSSANSTTRDYGSTRENQPIRNSSNSTTRDYGSTRENQPIRNSSNSTTRDYGSTRENQPIRNSANTTTRDYGSTRENQPIRNSVNTTTRDYGSTRSDSPRINTQSSNASQSRGNSSSNSERVGRR